MSGLFADPILQAGFAVLVVINPICIIVAGVRFYAARLTKRRVAMGNWFAAGTFICLVFRVVFLSLNKSQYNGSDVVDILNEAHLDSVQQCSDNTRRTRAYTRRDCYCQQGEFPSQHPVYNHSMLQKFKLNRTCTNTSPPDDVHCKLRPLTYRSGHTSV